MPICLEDVEEYLELPELAPAGKAMIYNDRSRRLSEEQLGQAADLLKIIWRSPARHDLALVIAGICAKEGYNQGDCEALIVHVCGKAGDPEVRDRLLAVRSTYRAASLGHNVKAYSGLEAHLQPDSLEYFKQVMEVEPIAGEVTVEQEEKDPYRLPFRLTVKQRFPSFPMLMKGMIPSDPRGTVGYLTGLSQSFKSYLALDWAGHISQGMNWHGHDTTQAQVWYVAAEGGYKDIFSRLKAWETFNKTTAENLYCRLSPVNILDPNGAERAIKLCQRIKDFCPRLVFLDTLSQCAGSADENSAKDARAIYANAKRFGQAFGATVVIVHHKGKSEGNVMRGASAFFDDADFVFEMTRPAWQTGGMDCTLNCRKIKSGRLVLGHEMQAREVDWEEGEETGKDLVLVQKVLRSRFDSIPLTGD